MSSPIASSEQNQDDKLPKSIEDSEKSQSLAESEGMFSEHQNDVDDAEKAERESEWEEYREHPQPV